VDALLLVARLLLVVTFVVAGVAKLADRDDARRAAIGFGVPAPLAGILARGLPLVEFSVAVLLVPASTALTGAACAVVLLGLFSAAIAHSIAKGEDVDCHCFGQLHTSSAGWSALGRNAGLAALALLIVAGGESGTSATAWLTEFEPAVLVVLGLGAVALGGAVWMRPQLAPQQGRMLLKIDGVKRVLRPAGLFGEPAAAHGPPATVLTVGEPAPTFRLSGVDGRDVGLSDLLAPGLPLVLVFADPDCGPCRALLPEVLGWQRSFRDRLRVVMLNPGDPRADRTSVDSGLEVMFQRDREVSDAYGVYGTPSAVAVARDATIASPVASGAEQIRSLVERITPAIKPRANASRAGPALARPPLRELTRSLTTPLPRRRALAAGGTVLAAAVLGTRRAPPARAQGGPVVPGGPCEYPQPGTWCVGPGWPTLAEAICLPLGALCCPGAVPGHGIGGCHPAQTCCHFPDGRGACCGCPDFARTPCGQNPNSPAGVPRVCCSSSETCCGSGADAECCPAPGRCVTDANGRATCRPCADTITDLAECPDRVQRSTPTVNGCGGAGTPQVVTDFLDRFKEANFRPACDAHDICYGTCTRRQAECDARLLNDLRAICRATYSVDEFERRGVCLSQARAYYRAVSASGRDFYERAQREFCQCCPDAPGERERLSPPPLPRPTAPARLTPQGESVTVSVSCRGPTVCRGSLALSLVVNPRRQPRSSGAPAASRRWKILLGKRAFLIPAGEAAEVRVPLSRKGRRLLRRRRQLTILATARAQLPDGKRLDTGLDSFELIAQRGRPRYS
jgi:thiol-disulfide isomerase/thioredoxin/uncharacterized membrane protein YphA (DoxX/SURF4 family)